MMIASSHLLQSMALEHKIQKKSLTVLAISTPPSGTIWQQQFYLEKMKSTIISTKCQDQIKFWCYEKLALKRLKISLSHCPIKTAMDMIK